MKTVTKIISILLMAALMSGIAIAQSDGGGKKKKKARVEQARPSKKPQRQASKPTTPKPASKPTTSPEPQIQSTIPEPSRHVSKPTSGNINGHEWVDLGLSVKWATCNVGAFFPSDYGYYLAWGETSPKSSYDESNSKTYRKNIGDISGKSSYDAARANWGSSWRLPTKSECQELVDRCRWTWTTYGGRNGYEVIGPNGNSIFLPAAGRRFGTTLCYDGTHGYYWSGAPREGNMEFAYHLWLLGSDHSVDWRTRGVGGSVRPVTE